MVMTDIEGSTQLWEREPELMRLALEKHDELAETCFKAFGGSILKQRGEGDSLFAVFGAPSQAVKAAAHFQNVCSSEPWGTSEPLRVRIAVHVGDVIERDRDYYGVSVNRCARIRSAGHGGQVLVSEAVVKLTHGEPLDDLELIALGIYRLKDLLHPEKIFQVCSPFLERHFPQLRTVDATPNNLPVELTSYVGRQNDVARVRSLISSHRLVTLTGTGGSGKTRLSIQVAAEALETAPSGIIFVDLGSFREGEVEEAVRRALAEVFGRSNQDAPPVERLAGCDAIVILDNCEHLIDQAAAFASELLRKCPELKLLATSRESLRIPGELTYRVESLSLPPKDATYDACLSSEAVQLFIERACERLTTFALTTENSEDIACICREVDGIPLAIEHAAGQIATMSPSEIRGGLQDRFRLLRTRNRGALGRHATLRATLDWSFGTLTQEEKDLLSLLSLFRGAWDMKSCKVLGRAIDLPDYETEEALNGLLSKSLISLESVVSETRRFRLLESTRAYAAEKLSSEHRERGLAGLFDHFYEQSQTISREESNSQMRVSLSREILNLETAVRFGIEAGDFRVFPLLYNLRVFLRRGGFARTGVALSQAALQKEHDPASLDVAHVWNSLGAMLWSLGKYEEAESAYLKAQRLYTDLEDEAGLSGILNNLAILAAETNRPEYAIQLFKQALDIYTRREMVERAQQVRINLGVLYTDTGDSAGAMIYFDEIAQNLPGNPNLRASYYNGRAEALKALGKDGEALIALAAAFDIWADWMDLPAFSRALVCLAKMDLKAEPNLRQAYLAGAFLATTEATGSGGFKASTEINDEILPKLKKTFGERAVEESLARGKQSEVDNSVETARNICALMLRGAKDLVH